MRVFKAKTSTEMSTLVYPALEIEGIVSDSRNGRVLAFKEPITMVYTQPWIRGNHTLHRDANPFFHVAEAMWMLAGRKDVKFLTKFNSNMGLYSDDGGTYNAAYGYRLRHHFGIDQLKMVVEELKVSPITRQAVAQIWCPSDLRKVTKDKACNMSLVFTVRDGKLELLVNNRSNDLVYGGVTGANPVHMSYFQQWVSDQLDVEMGNLTFVVNNAHVYLDLYKHWENLKAPRVINNCDGTKLHLADLLEIEKLCCYVVDDLLLEPNFNSTHINNVVVPILNTWTMRKSGKYSDDAIHEELAKCVDDSLFEQCSDWLEERT